MRAFYHVSYVSYPWHVRKLQVLARWINRYADSRKRLTSAGGYFGGAR